MIVIKEEFVGSDKYLRAYKLGRGEAIALWLALKCYASQHPGSEGFVPDEDLECLPGAPRAARKVLPALVDCGRLLPDGTRSAGLVEATTGGWKLHDYLDHSVTPEETELRRERARLKKQKQRQDQRLELAAVRSESRDLSRGHPGDSQGDTRGDEPADVPADVPAPVPPSVPPPSLAGAPPPACTPASAPVRAGPRPQPSLPHSNSNPDPDRAREGIRGHERVEPTGDHRRYASDHGLDLDAYMRRFRQDPRSAGLDTPTAWQVITRMLEKAAAARQGKTGAA